MYRTLSAAAVVIVTALIFAPTWAQSNSITVTAAAPTLSGLYETRSARVSLAGVDLGTVQGAATMFDRLDAAARLVCGEQPNVEMKPSRIRLFNDCRARVVRYAVKDLDAPQLTQIAAVH